MTDNRPGPKQRTEVVEMAEAAPYTAAHAKRFALLAAEFERLSSLREKTLTLSDMFDHDGFDIEDYCRGFRPNPHGEESRTAVRRFAQRYGIWLAGISDHVTDMGAFLHPHASLERLLPLDKAYAVDWYLDDTIGREKFAAMSDEESTRAARRREQIIALCRSTGDAVASDAVEEAMLTVLGELRDGSTREWYERFVRQWVEHLGMMCRDQNARTLGFLPGVEEYTERRIVMSGMPHMVSFGEFAAGRFLARRDLVESGSDALVDRISHRINAACCLSNDVFSFPRELHEGCDANAVVLEALNHPQLTLAQAVTAAMARTRQHTAECLDATAALDKAMGRISSNETKESLEEFMRAVQDILRATWVWQMHSPRYRETRAAFR